MWFVQRFAFSGVGATSATQALHGVVSASITNSASVTTNVTLYHINPLSYSAAPVDMDLGDVAGDLYFDISQVPQAFSCHGMLPKPSYCVNKETHGQDLGVTKVVLALSEQRWALNNVQYLRQRHLAAESLAHVHQGRVRVRLRGRVHSRCGL